MTTSLVYYRKWRPSSFSELVGQEHVATTIRQSIRQGRVSHSYLFCGPRGSGKTTTARIVAKAVNCLDPKDGDPCNNCAICQSANDGRFLDIIELDAASNRGIDEIRDIRDKVNFAPVQGQRKVYIIDEAHMLTDAASNAFLKTLEEPPAHVIFVLCTTEVHRIPPTIISRCQRFDFRRIPSEQVHGRLAEIAESEGVTVSPEALRLIARYSSGSLRDAENLLEQVAVSYGDGVGLKQVEDLLGMGSEERSLELVNYLLMGNTSASLSAINRAAWDGTDLRQLHRQTSELLRAVMHLQWGGENNLDLPGPVIGNLKELVGNLPPWRIVKALKIWGPVNMRYDAPSTLPLELAVVEICEDTSLAAPAPQPAPAASAPPPPATAPARQRSREAAPPPPRQPERARTVNSGQSPAPAGRPPAKPAAPVAASDPALGEIGVKWLAAVRALGRYKGRKYNLGALLRDCRANAVSLEGQTLVLPFTNNANLERMQEEMEDPGTRDRVNEALAESFGAAYEFRLTLANGANNAGVSARNTQQLSPLVRAAQAMGARILEEVEE